jgi:hypothetical protein
MKTLSSFFPGSKWKYFNRRITTAVNMQTREHNEPNAPDSTNAVKAVEIYARKAGLKTIWPGLYPIFEDEDKRQYFLN